MYIPIYYLRFIFRPECGNDVTLRNISPRIKLSSCTRNTQLEQ